jgi:hypothetical protein
MQSFKNFLSEHIILGDFKNSKTGIYKASLAYGDKSKMIIIPYDKKKLSYDVFEFTQKSYDMLQDIYDKSDPDAQYPYNEIKLGLANKRDAIIKSTQFKGNLPKAVQDMAREYLYKKDQDDLGLSFTLGHYRKEIDAAGSVKNYYSKEREKGLLVTVVGLSSLIINSKSKSIWVENKPIEHANRISKINSNTAYIIPLADTYIEDNRLIYKMLQSLCKKDKSFKDYSFIDVLTRNQERTNVGDILNGAGEVGKSNTNYNNIFKKRGSISVYHGTDMKTYKDHISKRGLLPGKGIDYVDKIKGHSEHNNYFTTNLADARKYAVRASGARPAVVLEVKIDDFNKITFDEDNLFSGIRSIPDKIMVPLKVTIFNECKRLEMNLFRHYIYHIEEKGLDSTEIEPSAVRNYIEGKQKSPILDRCVDLIGSYAIGKSSFTFAYKGRIPPGNIKIKEQMKSISYKDKDGPDSDWDKKNFKKKYSKIIKSIKVK